MFVLVFTSINLAPPFLPKPAKAATFTDAKLDFDLADEASFIQENATETKFSVDGKVGVGKDTVVGGVTAVSSVISNTAYSTVTDDLTVPATGVITSWRVYSVNNTTLKLKAYQKNGSNNYTLRGDSTSQSVSATSVNGPFSANVSVVSGDKIGLYGAFNPYRTTGGLSFFGWNNGGDFTGTGSFANNNGAFSHPNVEFTLTQYSTAQPYYVTTSASSSVKTKHWTAVNSVSITQNTPTNTSIKYLISFDGRATWKYWTGSAWAASSLANLQTDGMSKATLEGLSSANWGATGGWSEGTEAIDVAIDLATTDNTVAPTVDLISFSYEAAADVSLDFDTADEGQFIQQDAANGTDFGSGSAGLHLIAGTPGLYDLTGGTGGQSGQTTYTAANGTTAVSSAPTWSNSNFYYMQYMFDGSGLSGTPTTTQYWLTNSSGTQTLTFTFPSQLDLDYVRVYPYTRADAWSSYSVAVSTNATSWTFVAGSGNTSTGVGTGFTHTSIGSAGDNFDYQIDGSYKYVKFTLTQQASLGVTLDEIQFYTLGNHYPLSTGYYVTTSDANQLDVSSWTSLGQVRFTQTTPASTTLKYLVSFDDRATWKYWNGSSWSTSTLGNIGTNGNASSTLEALTYADWEASGGFNPGTTQKLDFATEYKTADQLVTPTLSQITVEYSTYSPAPPTPTNDSTIDNSITLSRYKAGASATVAVAYTLQNTKDGTLTITLPAGFTVTGSFTAGTCSGGGTIDTFGHGAQTLTAEKHACAGTVSLSGATVTNPSSPGLYVISWVNDDPGEGGVAIVDDDQVTVSAQVASSITFDIDASTTDTETSAPYAVALGAVSTANGKVSGATDGVNFIWMDLETNASSGALVTVKNLNGANGLVSASSSTHMIPSTTATQANGVANYGLCVVGAAETGGALNASSPFAGTCAADSETNAVGGLTTTPQAILNTGGGTVAGGRAQVAVSAAVSAVTQAHNDYSDTLTFIATGTF